MSLPVRVLPACDLPDRFATARLRAEKLDERHLPDLTALHLDEDASRFLGGVRSPEATRAYLDVSLAHWDRYGFGLYALMDETGAFAGRAGVRHVTVEETPEVEIAYALAKPFWARGLASEIAEALTARALAALRPASLVGVVVVGNAPSCRVLEKTGYIYERQVTFHDAPCRLYRVRPSA